MALGRWLRKHPQHTKRQAVGILRKLDICTDEVVIEQRLKRMARKTRNLLPSQLLEQALVKDWLEAPSHQPGRISQPFTIPPQNRRKDGAA